ncbi:MAG: DUF547 domain-containing protein [Planctomycetota bacterium]
MLKPPPYRPAPLPLAAIAALAFALTGCTAAPNLPADVRLDAYDDAPYAEVLTASVRGGLVDYRAITDDPGTLDDLDGRLDVYLDAVARFGPESTPEQFPTEDHRLAYHLNAYNALMIRKWLDGGARTASPTRKVPLQWFVLDRWRIDGKSMTFQDLEQRLIRPVYNDPRIHAALVCGAIDCPPLLDEPFDGDRLDAQLDAVSRAWFNDPEEQAVFIDDNGRVFLSAIFGWYRDDYRESGGLAATVDQYLDDDDPRKQPALDALAGNTVKFKKYDWTINQAPLPPEIQ